MQTPAKVFFGAWIGWLGYEIARFITELTSAKSPPTTYESSITFSSVAIMGAAVLFAWWIYHRPKRSLIIWFRLICADLVWKFWIGGVLAFLLPGMGGHSFTGALAQSWSQSTATIRVTLATFLPMPLIVISIFYWPAYCWKLNAKNVDPVA